jgi:hypothetical protein
LTNEFFSECDRSEPCDCSYCYGTKLHVHGAKDDLSKLPVELVPVEAIEAIAKVMDFGRKKYTENGWKSVPQAYRRYLGALLRHSYALLRGEVMDNDSGMPHIYHIACNAAFLCWFHDTQLVRHPFEPPATEAEIERCVDYESANQAKMEGS